VQTVPACPAQAFIQQPTANTPPTVFLGDHHAQCAPAMAYVNVKAADNGVFYGSYQHAASISFN
jgi:hypothetical protein